MSYFEYIISGDLTPEFEEKTKMLYDKVNSGTAFYNILKYVDEELTPEKKIRTLTIASHLNITRSLYELIQGAGLNFQGYFKQRLI